jgi:hypothetical protein
MTTAEMHEFLQPRSGRFEVLVEGQRVGTETWSSERTDRGGLKLASRIEMSIPEPNTQTFEIDLDTDLTAIALRLRIDLQDASIRSRQWASADYWVAEIRRPGQDTEQVSLKITEATEVDFGSPLFNSLTINRLALDPGEGRDLEVVFVSLPEFVPSLERQTYERADLAALPPPSGVDGARAVYLVGPREVEAALRPKIWVGEAGLVLYSVYPPAEGRGETAVRAF